MDQAGFQLSGDALREDKSQGNPVASNAAAAQPGIVHFGTGRRFRAAVAPLVHRMLEAGYSQYGIVAVSQSDDDTYKALVRAGGSYQLFEHQNGQSHAVQIGSIVGTLDAQRDRSAIIGSIADPRTSLITLTISDAEFAAGHDAEACSEAIGSRAIPDSTAGQIVAGLAERYAAGCPGLSVLMCDNKPGNNQRFASLIDAIAVAKNPQLADWIAMNVRFPAVHCDRLLLSGGGGESDSADIAVEAYAHWVIEDKLGDEHRALRDVGALVVVDVDPFLRTRERLLDGGLLLIGCVGMLRGHVTLDEAYADPDVAQLFERYVDEARQGLPTIKDLDLDRYVESLKSRFANPALRLRLDRCAQNGSERIPRTALPTVIGLMREGKEAVAAAATIAAWMLHATSAELNDSRAEALWSVAARTGDDWPELCRAICDLPDIFGTFGQNDRFRDLVQRSIGQVPGLESLIAG
jgi:mannitol-1-phosphate/altronate dehydrogenase